jgi:hypothetical protein
MILGIGYYFKKHVPDKFDKFLSYGMDVNSPISEKPPGLNIQLSPMFNGVIIIMILIYEKLTGCCQSVKTLFLCHRCSLQIYNPVCLCQPWWPFIAGKVGAGSTKAGKGNPKSCLGRVFQFKLGCSHSLPL